MGTDARYLPDAFNTWRNRGLYFMAGYMWASITRTHRPVSAELMAFRRKQQLTPLKRLLRLA